MEWMHNKFNDKVIGLYRPVIASPERLKATTIGRQEELEELLEKLDRFHTKKKKQHFLYIAPRGVGKTHFLRLLEIRIKQDENLTEKFIILRFPEENHRLLSFADFLLGIADILSEKTDDEQLKNAHAELEVETDDQKICNTLIPLFDSVCKAHRKNLIVILENIDAVLGQQMKSKQSIHAMRKYLMETENLIFVGASPSYFSGFDDVKHPFFGFFDTVVLPELTRDQTVKLIRKNLEFDKKKELIIGFDELIPRIKALYEMTGGNCRLLMILYNLIAEENILDVIRQFQELLDRISPFYQDRIKDLAPQERALIENMALMRNQYKTPAAIATKLRKTPQLTSSILKRLLKAGYLIQTSHPNDKRSKIYRIKEGFFDLWLAMSQSRYHNKYIPYLVDFFTIWYVDEKSREKKRQDIRYSFKYKDSSSNDNVDTCRETVLNYLTEIGDSSEKNQVKLDLTNFYLSSGQTEKAKEIYSEIEIKNEMPKHIFWISEQSKQWLSSGEPPEIREQINNMIQCWRDYRTGELEAFAAKAYQLGIDLTRKGLHEVNIAFAKEKIEKLAVSHEKMLLIESVAISQSEMGLHENALDHYLAAYEIAIQIEEKLSVLAKLSCRIANEYVKLQKYDFAQQHYKKGLDFYRAYENRVAETFTLNSIAVVYLAQNNINKVLQCVRESLKLCEEIKNQGAIGATLSVLVICYVFMDERQLVVKDLVAAYQLAKSMNSYNYFEFMKVLGIMLGCPNIKEELETLMTNSGISFDNNES